jgi:hypothetical protein
LLGLVIALGLQQQALLLPFQQPSVDGPVAIGLVNG